MAGYMRWISHHSTCGHCPKIDISQIHILKFKFMLSLLVQAHSFLYFSKGVLFLEII